jgi:LysM repeat protein
MDQKQILILKKLVAEIDDKLVQAKQLLSRIDTESGSTEPQSKAHANLSEAEAPDGTHILYGTFNGENFVSDDGTPYPINPNYASKSKLVEGDTLKLTISPEGKFTFKTINPVNRKWSIAKLVSSETDPKVVVDGDEYKVLYASVTYYKAKSGDTLSVIVPAKPNSTWATIDAVLPKGI